MNDTIGVCNEFTWVRFMLADARAAMVVDADAFFRIAFSAVLERRFGFGRIIEASHYQEAVDQLSADTSVKLALFDLATPGLPDPGVLAALRDHRADLLVAVTANALDRHAVLAVLDAGLHGYVTKADGLPAVTAALATILEGSIYVPPGMAARADRGATDGPVMPAGQGGLTSRQLDVLRLLVEGRSNKEIARVLGLGEGTVKAHVAALLRVLRVPNRSAAAVTGSRILSAA